MLTFLQDLILVSICPIFSLHRETFWSLPNKALLLISNYWPFNRLFCILSLASIKYPFTSWLGHLNSLWIHSTLSPRACPPALCLLHDEYTNPLHTLQALSYLTSEFNIFGYSLHHKISILLTLVIPLFEWIILLMSLICTAF